MVVDAYPPGATSEQLTFETYGVPYIANRGVAYNMTSIFPMLPTTTLSYLLDKSIFDHMNFGTPLDMCAGCQPGSNRTA